MICPAAETKGAGPKPHIALKVGRSIAEEAEKLAPDRVTCIADAPGSPLGDSGPRGHGARQLIDLVSSLETLRRFGSVIWASVWTCDQLEYGTALGKDESPPKLSRSEAARRIIQEYIDNLREIIKKTPPAPELRPPQARTKVPALLV